MSADGKQEGFIGVNVIANLSYVPFSASGGSIETRSALIRFCNKARSAQLCKSDRPDNFVDRAFEPLEDRCDET